jgi:uncharacterized protein
MHSCIYVGQVRHQRFSPAEHRFRYGLSLMYLDLDELPQLLRSQLFLYAARFSPGSFCRDDHFGDPAMPLADSVREFVAAETGFRPEGPVRLLTQLRRYGYYFSPLNLYYCFDREGEKVQAVVAEVSNTPWSERHCYVLWNGNRVGPGDRLRFRHHKAFHVSPFMDMDFDYHWQLNEPEETLKVYLANHRGDERVFLANMVLHRRGLTRGQVFQSWLRFPWMTGQVVFAIYFEAFRLWMKKCPYYPHPGNHCETLR